SEHTVGSPVFRELHRRPGEVASILLQLALEFLEQSEGIRGGPGKSGQHLVVMQAAQLFGVVFHHRGSDGHLAVATHGSPAVAPDTKDGGRSNGHDDFRSFPDKGLAAARARGWALSYTARS